MHSKNDLTPDRTTSQPSWARRLAAGAMGTVLSITMSIPFGATQALAEEVNGQTTQPDGTTQAGTSQTAKKEIVYTRTSPTGQKKGIYVVNYFQTTDAEQVSDPGSYQSVENLTTSDALENKDGATEVTTLAGQPFYYQGDLDEGTRLPWDVEITYTLGGKEVAPEELAGQSGDLDIELKITGLDDGSATADFAKSFVVQAQGTFDNSAFALDTAKDATVATVGNKTLLTYLLIPGQDGDYHITGKATDFTYSGWQIR